MTEEARKPGTFTKGDKRINRKGRPKSFDALRALAQQIANEAAGDYTRIELILRSWSLSKDPRLQQSFVDIAYGKVPQRQEVTGEGGGAVAIRIVDETEASSD